MKRICLIVFFAVVWMVCPVTAAAAMDIDMENPDAEALESQIKQAISLDASEIKEKRIKHVLDMTSLSVALEPLTGETDVPDLVSVLLDQNCRQFYFTLDILVEYPKRRNLKSFISEDYEIYVPLSNGGKVFLMEIDGVWESVSVSGPPLYMNPVPFSTAAVSRCLQEGYKNNRPPHTSAVISDLKIVCCYEYDINFAYYTDNGQEYVIPFSGRPDFTGLEDGRIYLPSEVIAILGKNYPPVQNPYADGGGGNIGGAVWQIVLWRVLPAFGGLLLLAGVVLLIVWKRKKAAANQAALTGEDQQETV